MKPIKISGNPYNEIVRIILAWCELNCYCDFAVTISSDGRIITEFLELAGFSGIEFIWKNDWWEGEKEIYLLGFMPFDDLRIYGIPGKKTHGNDVRSMADKDLAEFLENVSESWYQEGYTKETEKPNMSGYPSTATKWYEWLQQEVKE